MPSSGPVKYPEVYKSKPDEKAAEEQMNKEFWNQNLDEKDKEGASNLGFWDEALGGLKSKPKPQSQPKDERQAEIKRSCPPSQSERGTCKALHAVH